MVCPLNFPAMLRRGGIKSFSNKDSGGGAEGGGLDPFIITLKEKRGKNGRKKEGKIIETTIHPKDPFIITFQRKEKRKKNIKNKYKEKEKGKDKEKDSREGGLIYALSLSLPPRLHFF